MKFSGCVIIREKGQAVKKGRYTEEKVSYALRKAETGTAVAELGPVLRSLTHAMCHIDLK